MAIQYVNTGSGANAGDGDSLRTAFYKINNNFAELSALSGTDSSVIIVNAFPPTTSTEGTIWYDTVSGRNFIYYDGFWVDAAPPAVEPINLTTVSSHILPGANLTYDLGSTSSQWRSLYVGSSTIYLGNIPLSISPDGKLLVNGIDSATTSSLIFANSSVSIDDNNLYLHNRGFIRNSINYEDYEHTILQLIPDSSIIEQNPDQNIIIDPSPTFDEPNHVHIRTGGTMDASSSILWLGGRLNSVRVSDIDRHVVITAGTSDNVPIEWHFHGETGALEMPSIVPGISIDFLRDSPGNHLIRLEDDWKLILQARAEYANDGHLELEAGQNTKILIHGDGSSIDYIASNGSTTQTWTMNLSGEIVFPDGSVQLTAFTGTSALLDITNTNGIDTTYYLTFVENRTNDQIVRADVDLTFNSWSNTLGVGNVTATNTINAGGILFTGRGIHEKFTTSTTATTTTTYDCSTTQLFYHSTTGTVANWTANFINLNLEDGRATSVSIIINQGNTGYYPSAIQIGGVGQTLNWQGNTTPTVSSNRNDVITFSILNNSGSYLVLGQVTGF